MGLSSLEAEIHRFFMLQLSWYTLYLKLFKLLNLYWVNQVRKRKKNNRLRNDESKTVKRKEICFMDEKVFFLSWSFEIQRKMICFKSCLVNEMKWKAFIVQEQSKYKGTVWISATRAKSLPPIIQNFYEFKQKRSILTSTF